MADSRPEAEPTDHGRLGRNLPAAIITGVTLGASVVLTLFLLPFGFILIVAALTILATVELARNFAQRGIRVPAVPIGIGTGLAMILPYLAEYLPSVNGPDTGLDPNAMLLGLLGLTAVVSMAARMRRGAQGFLADASASLLIVAYIPLLGSFVPLMLAGDQGVDRVLGFVIIVVASDTGGYAAGVMFGRHPLAPVISPKKSWEGFAGSMVLATTAAVLLSILLLEAPWWLGLILGPALVVTGTVGDLIESLIKRDLQIKDMSNFLPGHGGVMDRLDSLLFSAPLAWFVLYLFVPGG